MQTLKPKKCDSMEKQRLSVKTDVRLFLIGGMAKSGIISPHVTIVRKATTFYHNFHFNQSYLYNSTIHKKN